MIHIWHEDNHNSATTQFWNFMCANRVSSKLINVSVQGFNGNARLSDYVKNCTINLQDKYIILVDKVIDNSKALKYYIEIKKNTAKYSNVYVADVLSFEYMMLRFKYFVKWTEPLKITKGYEAAKQARHEFIKCVDTGDAWINCGILLNYVINTKGIDTTKFGWQAELTKISSENLATHLLSAMTSAGISNLSINKTCFGQCWQCNCCAYYIKSIGDKKCQLFKYKKTSHEKATNLWNGTLAKKIINKFL